MREPVKALAVLTAVEALPRSELINRTHEVEFDRQHKKAAFMPEIHQRRLRRHSSRILSGLFQLFAQEVLPGIDSTRQP